MTTTVSGQSIPNEVDKFEVSESVTQALGKLSQLINVDNDVSLDEAQQAFPVLPEMDFLSEFHYLYASSSSSVGPYYFNELTAHDRRAFWKVLKLRFGKLELSKSDHGDIELSLKGSKTTASTEIESDLENADDWFSDTGFIGPGYDPKPWPDDVSKVTINVNEMSFEEAVTAYPFIDSDILWHSYSSATQDGAETFEINYIRGDE